MTQGRIIRLASALALCGGFASAQTVTPSDIDLILDPGQVTSEIVTVCIPGEGGVGLADVYLLCDTTGSMGGIIATVKANAGAIFDALLDRPGTDIQIGVGQFKDFACDEPNSFAHLQDITDSEPAIQAGIDNWDANGGCDTPENGFYALHQVVTDEAGVGWRAGAKRIVVLFGDVPSHEPICAALSGDPHGSIDRDTVLADFLANGPGGSVLITIDSSGFGGLNASGSSGDYTPVCGSSSFPAGGFQHVVDGTGGTNTLVGNPATVITAVLDAVETVLSEVDISLNAVGDIAAFVTAIVPPVHFDVLIPGDPTEEVCVDFEVFFEGIACVENSSSYEGQLEGRIDGVGVASANVTIAQPVCALAICTMFLGIASVDVNVHSPAGPPDKLLVLPLVNYPVLLDAIPSWTIPNDPVLAGLHIYFQIGMSNPFDFPTDPIKMTNGLDVILGSTANSYGTPTGMEMWLAQPPLLGGKLKPQFSIDGF